MNSRCTGFDYNMTAQQGLLTPVQLLHVTHVNSFGLDTQALVQEVETTIALCDSNGRKHTELSVSWGWRDG